MLAIEVRSYNIVKGEMATIIKETEHRFLKMQKLQNIELEIDLSCNYRQIGSALII